MLSNTFEATSSSNFGIYQLRRALLALMLTTNERCAEFAARAPQMRLASCVLAVTLTLSTYPSPAQQLIASDDGRKAVIWTDPGNIRDRNLFYGIGGKKHVPSGPFTYAGEDKGGTSPKFHVTDANGEKWTAKLGPESQAEVAASRLLWAVGFAANENYYVTQARIPGIRGKQKRGRNFIDADATAHGIRLQRHTPHEKKVENWNWRNNPLYGTREFNGLRVMMALLSNWDLKDENNAVYELKDEPSEFIYGVSDVGASFGTSGKSFTNQDSKNNLQAYRRHKFIARVTPKEVDFNFPTHPSFIYYFPLFEIPFVIQETRHHWVGRHIPRKDVEWIGSLLSQLSHDQIGDAFRAAGYSPDAIEAFTAAVESRIAEIKKL